MQQLSTTPPQPEPENRCPDCLWMELEEVPVASGQHDLYLTIHFNEQWEPLLNGRVKFGLKGGELKLKLENGEILYTTRNLTGRIQLSDYCLCQVSTNNSKMRPSWKIEKEKISGFILKGLLEKEKLGTWKITDPPSRLEAIFEVSQQFVHLVEVEGLWPPNLSNNKISILKIQLIQYLLQSKLQPYLSRVELHDG